jgi:two-component system sensor histidine kinase MprB
MLVAGAAVAASVLLASLGAYLVIRHELRAEVDDSLRDRVAVIARRPELARIPPPLLGGAGGYVQLVFDDGRAERPRGATVALPVDNRTLAVARGERDGFFSDTHVAGTHVRMVTAPTPFRVAVQVARPLTEQDRTLRRVGFVLLFLSAGGVALAAILGGAVARAALRPVAELTGAVEHVRETGDLTRRVDSPSTDELGRLAGSFNEMLDALETSVSSQRQLVADASHELRTPLTSLRTNLDVLDRARDLPEDERGRLLRDVRLQLEELTTLVTDLVELARGGEREAPEEDVRLDELVAAAVERARAHSPGIVFEERLEPTVVRGAPQRLDRAVANLLDNAAKWSPAGASVEVAVAGGAVTVRDHGPGISPEDLPHVFDRFYRAPASRSLPGSGLGLAIVRQVADAHGGTVTAEAAKGGGAVLRLSLRST